jgi:hypothetical protein
MDSKPIEVSKGSAGDISLSKLKAGPAKAVHTALPAVEGGREIVPGNKKVPAPCEPENLPVYGSRV